jgi:hypothetical protein
MKRLSESSAAALAAAFFLALAIGPARAADLRHPRQQRDIPPALQQSLSDHLSDEAGKYFDAEDEKKANHQVYVDLQQKFEYLPNWGPHNSLVVSAKMGGAEYDPSKPGSSKGAATGTLKYLVFTYALQNGKWVEITKPKWESQALGAAAGKQMTKNQIRGDQRKAAIEKSAQVKAAAAAAAEAAQKAANHD